MIVNRVGNIRTCAVCTTEYFTSCLPGQVTEENNNLVVRTLMTVERKHQPTLAW